MKEPINPVKLIKDSQVFEPHRFVEFQTPFIFSTKGVSLFVNSDETPIYFKRKTNRGSYNIGSPNIELELIDIKYRIAKIDYNGIEIGYWIDKDGNVIDEY